MDFKYITLWFCQPCQNYLIDPGLRHQFTAGDPTCAKCQQKVKQFIEYEQIKTNNERTNDEVSRGFAFTQTISTKS